MFHLTGEADAKKGFYSKYKCKTETQFVSNFTAVKTAAICEQGVYVLLNELHEGFGSGAAVFNVPGKTLAVGKDGAQIPQSLTQLLLPDKAKNKRWNFFARKKAVQFLVDNKADLHSIFRGSWSGVQTWLYKRIAAELVWSTVSFAMNLKDFDDVDKVDGKVVESTLEEMCPAGLKPRAALVKDLPLSRFEIDYHDWEVALTSSTAVKAEYVFQNLVKYLMDAKGTKLKVSSGVGARCNVEDLESPTNFLFTQFVLAMKSYFFEQVNTPARRKAASGPSVEPGFTKGDFGLVNYIRNFAGLTYHIDALKPPGDFHDSEDEADQHYNRDLTSITTGNEVKVLLLQKDVFTLAAAWKEALETPSNIVKYSERLALGFADPPWGVNKDSNDMGGIDMKEERWGR